MSTSSAVWRMLARQMRWSPFLPGTIVRSVSTAVDTDDKVTVDNFADWLVNERPMCWGGWVDTSSDRELTTPILRGWMFFEHQIINAAYFLGARVPGLALDAVSRSGSSSASGAISRPTRVQVAQGAGWGISAPRGLFHRREKPCVGFTVAPAWGVGRPPRIR